MWLGRFRWLDRLFKWRCEGVMSECSLKATRYVCSVGVWLKKTNVYSIKQAEIGCRAMLGTIMFFILAIARAESTLHT
jgi:hypothetical protein